MITMKRIGVTAYDMTINGKKVKADCFMLIEDVYMHIKFNKNQELMARYNIQMPNEKKLTLPDE